jgi:hypothetical protein
MEEGKRPVRVADLRAGGHRTIEVHPFLGDEETVLNVTYNMNALTTGLQTELEAAMKEQDGRAITKMLANIIVSWDLLGDDDKPLGTSPDVLDQLPAIFLMRVGKAIGEDMMAPFKQGGSDGG